jgi:hypothetical protein
MGSSMKNLIRPDATKEAKRLQACPALAPQSDEGRKEIVDCLMRHCEDYGHASRTMTHVLDNCPEPRNLLAEIKAAAVETLHMPESVPDGCDHCRLEPDPITHKPRWMAHVPGERNGYSMAVRCACARGKWLLRRDQERGAPAPEQHGGLPMPDVRRIAAGDNEE